MSEELIVRHCSPTLAGLKTGSLFPARFTDENELRNTVRSLNHMLLKKGLRVLPLRYRNGTGLIYVYRPAHLQNDLQDEAAAALLAECGYCGNNAGQCIAQLVKRLQTSEEFPHEIGLFLGYPTVDVQGFIQNKAQNFKCSGLWKVYGDVEQTQKTFALYKKCTRIYCEQWSRGKDIERLTVADSYKN